MSRNPTEDLSHWESAIEHYHWDRLSEAYPLIRHHGIGEAGSYIRWYRLIEAEYVSRLDSERIELSPWLTFEYRPADISGLSDHLARLALQSCERIGTRLGWQHESQTIISILAKEVDAPWATHPFGYCADKYPYSKICLPDHLVDDPEEYSEAVAHEYAHVISLNLADGAAPRWLEEAVSVLAEDRVDEAAASRFRSDRSLWLSPERLESRFNLGEEEDPDGELVWMAYQQAGWIGRHLSAKEGETKVGELLREHANQSLWRNLGLTITGKERVEGAMQEVYGISVARLFEQAYGSLCEG